MNKNKIGPLGPEIIIVLGAGVLPDGTPTERTIARTTAAAELAHTLPDATIIVSGDGRTALNKRKRSQTEASRMAVLLQQAGIRKERILLEHQARDTVGNFVLVAARYLMGNAPRKIHVVTSPFHAERALTLARGVLGPKWTIELHASAVVEGDEPKGANESGGIGWAHRFFEKTTAGNIKSAIERLLAIGKPEYRSMPWLVAKARTADLHRSTEIRRSQWTNKK